MQNQVSFIPLGGIGDVTKNMYLYEYQNQILIVDCGLGFADETMLGVDLLLPDVSYLIQSLKSGSKQIIGMVLTHGHEDHIGALPFILPSLPTFPIYATPFTAALANEKLAEFRARYKVEEVKFEDGRKKLGDFDVSFIRVTHSVPDSSNIFIKTPIGNFYHASDFKFDDTPFDGKTTNIARIESLAKEGVLCLMSDCLGSEKQGRSLSEQGLFDNFVKEIKDCSGKFIVTTYSSNISRLNQVIQASEKVGRKVCFVGRSLIKTKEVAKRLGILRLKEGQEIEIDRVKNYRESDLTFLVAGSQGQEESAMARIANGEQREIRLKERDIVVFSADPIPGNEVSIYGIIDTIARSGARILYSSVTRDFHVSGHAYIEDLKKMVSMVAPKWIVPIGGNFRHMALYRNMVEGLGYSKNNVFLIDNGQEIIFTKEEAKLGKKIPVKNVYVDEISEDVVESFVLRDRQKLSSSGIIIVLTEIDSENGQLVGRPDIIVRGITSYDTNKLSQKLFHDLKLVLRKKGRVINWAYIRKLVGDTAERRIFKDLHRRPLVLPIVIEV